MPLHGRRLPSGVELWSNQLDGTLLLPHLLETLDEDERRRAARFRFERDRVRFIERRAFVRQVLARYVGGSPAKVRIRTTPQGKPELQAGSPHTFNVSHSDGLVVVVVAHGRRVGVDIERVRPVSEAMAMARRFFAPAEMRHLESRPSNDDARAFLTIWTRKESYTKAIGDGLRIPLDQFDVSSSPRVSHGRPRGPLGDSRYEFTSLDNIDGFVGAVTVSDDDIPSATASKLGVDG